MTFFPLSALESRVDAVRGPDSQMMSTGSKVLSLTFALLLILACFACTSGGSSSASPTPPAASGLSNSNVEAEGGDQKNAFFTNSTVIGEDVEAQVSTNPGRTLVNRSGFTPKTLSGH